MEVAEVTSNAHDITLISRGTQRHPYFVHPEYAQPGQAVRVARKPTWLKVTPPLGQNYRRLKAMLGGMKLHTVCQEANCPNIGHCYEKGTATFMILGDLCTRGCRFCDVKRGKPGPVDPEEPKRLAEAAGKMGLRHVVITSVTRDDLSDGGASQFAACIRETRKTLPRSTIEVLISDLRGSREALEIVLAACPDVLNHNVETVPRLYTRVRLGAMYNRSLELLARSKEIAPHILSKSGIMLGLGERRPEIEKTLWDLRGAGVDILTIGQYLSPSAWHLPVEEYVHPDVFEELRVFGLSLGFREVYSGPLVRSSFNADEQLERAIGALPVTNGHLPSE